MGHGQGRVFATDTFVRVWTNYVFYISKRERNQQCCPVLGEEQSRVLGADATSFTLENLRPDEAVVIGVTPVVGQRLGEVATIASRTNGGTNGGWSGGISGLRVVDVTTGRIRVTWAPASRSTGYKIMWRRADGGQRSALSQITISQTKEAAMSISILVEKDDRPTENDLCLQRYNDNVVKREEGAHLFVCL